MNPYISLSLLLVTVPFGVPGVSLSAEPDAEDGEPLDRSPADAPAEKPSERRPAKASPSTFAEKLPVAVLDFENATGDEQLNHWSHGLRWLLTTSLEEVKTVRLYPSSAVVFGLRKLGLESGADVDAEKARRIGEWLEARRVVFGRYRRHGDQWEWQARLQNVATGEELLDVTAKGVNLMGLGQDLVGKIAAALGLSLSSDELKKVARRPTTSQEALDLYIRTNELTDSADKLPLATKFLSRAITLDPRFAAAGVRLAWLLWFQDRNQAAAELVQQVLRIRPEEPGALVLVGHILAAQRKPDEAERAFHDALRLRPDDVNVLNHAAQFFLETRRPDRAAINLERLVTLDPTSAQAYARLGRAYLFLRQPEQATAAVENAVRLGPESTEVLLLSGQIYETLNNAPRALDCYERLIAALRSADGESGAIRSVEQRAERLRQSLAPRFNRALKPKAYSADELGAALREKLTEEELALVVNPLENNEKMRRWARELARDAASDMERARAIFDGLTRRVQPEKGGRARTALQVFAAWNREDEVFNCQEYAKLYVALARAVGLEAFYVHIERDYAGQVVDHDCAAAFVDGKALLVDPAYRWFGVRHASFSVLDDLQVVAHQLFQGPGSSGGLARCRVALKLHPDFAWGQLRYAAALLRAGDLNAGLEAVDEADRLEPDRWDARDLRGHVAMEREQFEEAERYFREALAVHPRSDHLHRDLGAALAEQGRLIEAREELKQSVRLSSGDAESREARRAIAEISEKLGTLSKPLASRLLEAKERTARGAELGPYSDLSRLEIVGSATYDSNQVVSRLGYSPFFLTELHPRAALDETLRFLEREIHKGFLAGGFPHAEVRAAVDDARRRLTIRVSEGSRLRAGPVVVEGNEQISTDAIVAVLSEPPESLSSEETKKEAFWRRGDPAPFGRTMVATAERLVKRVYGKRGYLQANVKVTVTERPDGIASLDVRVLREGPQSRLGEVTFLGRFSDDAEELKKKLGLSEGMIADSDLSFRVAAELEALGRYHQVRTRDIPGARAGEVDLEVFLVQAGFAPSLAEPPSETREALEKALGWITTPQQWSWDHVMRVIVSEPSPDSSIPVDAARLQVVLARDGFGLGLDTSKEDETLSVLRFALRGNEGVLAVPPVGLRSRFRAAGELMVNLSLKLLPPGSKSTWQFQVGFGFSPRAEVSFRLNPTVSPLGLTHLIEKNLETTVAGGGLSVTYVGENKRIPLGTVVTETGAVRFQSDFDIEDVRVTARSASGALAELFREAVESPADRDYEDVDLAMLFGRTATKLGSLAVSHLPEADRTTAFTLSVLSRRLFRDDGYAVNAVRRLLSLDFSGSDGEAFFIPVATEERRAWMSNPYAFFGQLVTAEVAPRLPLGSWPRVLLVESVCLVSGKSKYTDRELLRLLNSPDVGPLGHWVVGEMLSKVGMDVLARRFAERALALSTVDGFRRELALIDAISPGLLADLGLGLREISESEVEGVFSGASPEEMRPEIRNLRALWKARDDNDPYQLGEGLLMFLWHRHTERLLRARLLENWPGLVPVLAPAPGSEEELELSREPGRLRKYYVERGQKLEKEGKLKEAADHFRLALELQSDDHRLHEDLGRLLIQIGEYDVAFAELIAALELQKSCPRTRDLLRQLILGCIQDARTKDLDRARFYVRRLRAHTDPNDADVAILALLARAQSYVDAGQLENALASLEDARPALEAGELVDEAIASIRRRAAPDLLTYASIDARLETPLALVAESDRWRYFRGSEEPSHGLEWTEVDFDDGSWEVGRGEFGYGESGYGTELTEMRGSYSTLYCRRVFEVSDPSEYLEVRLRFRVDDGLVAYLNGEEVARARAGKRGERLAHDAVASDNAPEPLVEQTISVGPELLRAGTNVLALQGLNRSLQASSDFRIAARLESVPRADPTRDRERFHDFRTTAKGPSAARRLTYLEARILQRAGKHEEAAGVLRKLWREDPERPEPLRRLVESLRATGADEEAESLEDATARQRSNP